MVTGNLLVSEYVSCAAPSAANSNSLQQGYSEVEISFDGFPSDINDPTNVWQGSLWSAGSLNLRYHDPAVITNMKIGSEDALALYTVRTMKTHQFNFVYLEVHISIHQI